MTSMCNAPGYQLILLVGTVIVIALLGSLYVERGKIVTVCMVIQPLTSFVAGYKSGALYRSYFFPKRAPGWYAPPLFFVVGEGGGGGGGGLSVVLVRCVCVHSCAMW